MPLSRNLSRYLPPFLLASLLLGVYLSTLAPGLTWANSGSDGGDLITAARTGGIAHPTGYPWRVALPQSPLPFRRGMKRLPHGATPVKRESSAC